MRLVMVVFEGAQTLDFAGPAEVFAMAGRLESGASYAVALASDGGGMIRSTSGLEVMTAALSSVRPRASDTVLVSGGGEASLRAQVSESGLRAWLLGASRKVRRIGSVCSGSFVLAAAGLLDGRRAATHWSACERLAAFRPAATIDRNAIYVRDGKVWTSAGVTTGIDMALAMVEEDHGRTLADRIAAQLVLYARRPGFQSQFSDALVAQGEAGDPLAAVIGRARTRLQTLDVPELAKLAGLSVRTLHRRCQEHLGVSPAKLVEQLRVEAARSALSSTARSIKQIAHESGFGSGERMTRAFQRELGVRPRDVRLLFARRPSMAS